MSPSADDVLGAGVDRRLEVVLRPARGVHDDHAALLEQVRDRPGLAERPAVLAEDVAHLGAGAVAVVGERLDQDRHAAGPVALVHDRLDRVGVRALARALGDRALDVVLGHRGVARLLDRVGQRRVGIGVAAAVARGDRDRARELGELLTAARVHDRLLVLDRGPLRVSGHGTKSRSGCGAARRAPRDQRAREARGTTRWCASSALLEVDRRLPARQLAQLGGVDELPVDLAVRRAGRRGTSARRRVPATPADQLDQLAHRVRTPAAGVERLAAPRRRGRAPRRSPGRRRRRPRRTGSRARASRPSG